MNGKNVYPDYMCENSTARTANVRRRVISEKLIAYECAICSMGPMWQGKPMSLILDHINGINNDHRESNLRFVCPNCNMQLDTTNGKNRKKGAINWPEMPKLRQMVQETSTVQVGKVLGCSHAAVAYQLRKL